MGMTASSFVVYTTRRRGYYDGSSLVRPVRENTGLGDGRTDIRRPLAATTQRLQLEMSTPLHDRPPLHEYFVVLRRRKWLVLLVLLLVPAVAVALSLLQTARYQASAEVLLSRQNLAASLNNVTDQSLTGDPARLAKTQADLARAPQVARRAIDLASIRGLTPAQLLAASNVTAKTDADVLVFTVKDRRQGVATRLATLYARAYIGYRADLDTAALKRARREVLDRMSTLAAAGRSSSDLYASLADKEQQLATMEALQTSNASLFKPASKAVQIEPRPARNGLLGLALGLMLGLGIAFFREALDTHIRTADAISRRLRLPILAQIPRPPRSLRTANRLAMVEGPDTIYAEPFRILKTHLDFVNLERPATSIMVTSAVESEGKSTTAANLAIAAARAGRAVILVDLDFRHPYLSTFFPLAKPEGLSDVALGRLPLEEALVPVVFNAEGGMQAAPGSDVPHASGNGSLRSGGALRLLTAGTPPPNPGDFIGSTAVESVLADLSRLADLVLIDAAPLLGIGDALALGSRVDALIIVTRLNVVSRPMLRELERALEGCTARPLGIVVTDADVETGYGYGYGYAYQHGRTGKPSAGQKHETAAHDQGP